MKAFFSERAQGTIEYIVILAIIVVIALVVISIIASFSGSGTQITQNASTQYWISNYPIGVLGAQINVAPAGYDSNWHSTGCSRPQTMGIIIKNSSAEKITITSLTIGGTEVNTSNETASDTNDWYYWIKAVSGGLNGTYLLNMANRWANTAAPAIVLQAGETGGMFLDNGCLVSTCTPGATTTATLSINYTNSNNFSQTFTGTKNLYINCVQGDDTNESVFSPFTYSFS